MHESTATANLRLMIIKAALAYFGIVFGSGFLLGFVRVLIVVPRLGERWSELLEMPLMVLVMVLAARFVLRKFTGLRTSGDCLWTGLLALGMLTGAELLLVTVVQHQPISEYISSRDPVSGSVYLMMLLLFGLLPLLLRWRQFK